MSGISGSSENQKGPVGTCDPVLGRMGDGFLEEVTCKLRKVYQQREQHV